jgi:CRP-like cAMP-binding protein/predicted GNAT family N-acyltransferase
VTINIKIARSAKEIDDVFRLRYDVYVKEEGLYGNAYDAHQRIIDQFDVVPGAANIIAYNGDEPIATIRINGDTDIGLPLDGLYDYSSYRSSELAKDPVSTFGCAGMLAIKAKWRNKRKVIYALLKTAIGIGADWGSSHVLLSIRKETLSMYGRIGFEAVGEEKWIEEIQAHIVPMAALYSTVHTWAFGDLSNKLTPFWVKNLGKISERILLEPSEILFKEHDVADDAYAIDNGWMSISKHDTQDHELVLANLSQGELFGELALLEGGERSATATALTSTELIVIEKAKLLEETKKDPAQLLELLQYFAKRVRETDEFLMVHSFAPQTSRVKYALRLLWESAQPDRKTPGVRIAKVGVDIIATHSQIRESEVLAVLEIERMEGRIEYGKKFVRFLKEPDASVKRAELSNQDNLIRVSG